MASASAATCHMNRPYSQIYSMNDPRFFFPTSDSGSILYFSNVYDKWIGSDVTKFNWNASSNTLTLNGTLRFEDAELYALNGEVYLEYDSNVQTTVYSDGYPALSSGPIGFGVGNGLVDTQIILDGATTRKHALTNNSLGVFKILADDKDPNQASSLWGTKYELDRQGINNWFSNNSSEIPLDKPVLTVDDLPFCYSPCLSHNAFENQVSINLITNNSYEIEVKVSSYNAFGRTITLSRNYGFNIIQTATSAATFPTTTATQQFSITSQSATRNGIAFTGYTFSATGTSTTYRYTQSAVSVFDIFQPVGQLTWVITPPNSYNETDTYIFSIVLDRTQVAVTGVTRTANPKLDGSPITLAGTQTTPDITRTSGSGTLAVDATPTNTLLTVTRDGSSELQIDHDVLVSASTVQTFNNPSGSSFYLLLADLASSSGKDGETVYKDTRCFLNQTTGRLNIANELLLADASTNIDILIDNNSAFDVRLLDPTNNPLFKVSLSQFIINQPLVNTSGALELQNQNADTGTSFNSDGRIEMLAGGANGEGFGINRQKGGSLSSGFFYAYRETTSASTNIASFYSNNVSTGRNVINFQGNGTILNGTGTYGTISDINIKENIQDARSYLDDFCKLQVFRFSLKEEKSPEPTQIGFIAQQVETVFPNLVTETEEGVKAVKLSIINIIAVKVIQELATKVKSLEERLEKLEKMFSQQI